MKGNISNLILSNGTRKHSLLRILALVFAVAIIIVAIVFMLRGCVSDNEASGSYRAPLPEKIFEDTDNGFISGDIGNGISIPATTGIVLVGGEYTQSLVLRNPEANDCVFVISLYLSDGTLLFKSEPLRPSDSIAEIVLNSTLSVGTYQNAVFIYDCYTNDSYMNAISRCEFPIEIKVIE